MKKLELVLRLIAAGILFQTLYFKFSAAPESVYIFTQLHVEPLGRWFAGLSELVAVILILLPGWQIFGAFAAVGIMAGAILSHLFVLGIQVEGDGGLLFTLAVIVLLSATGIIILNREKLMPLMKEKLGVG